MQVVVTFRRIAPAFARTISLARIHFAGFIGALLVVGLTAPSAFADVVIRVQRTVGVSSKSPQVSTSVLSIAPDRLAQENTIFRGDRDVVWFIDHEDKTYTEIDQATVENVGGQVDQAMSKVQEELAKLPADQRAMIEETMKGMTLGAGTAMPKIEFKKTAETKTINGFPCAKFERRDDGQLMQFVYVASQESTGLQAADTAVFKEMASMIETLLGSLGPNALELMKSELSVVTQLDGWPILVQDLEGGKVVDEMLVQSILRETVPASTYEVPKGYTKETLELPSE